MSKFTVGQEVETRGGDKARVICTDAKIGGGPFNLVVLVKLEDGNDFIEWYDETNELDGFVHSSGGIVAKRDIKIPVAK